MAYSRDVPLARRLLYDASAPFLTVRGRSAELTLTPLAREERSGPPPLTVSIVTPSFNQREFLERTLASVLDQRYPALEYVVQDGGSTDGSVRILERYGAELTYWESRPDGGQSAAINAGFRRTTGEIMMYLNSDDVLFPGALRYVAEYFAAHPEVDVMYSHAVMIDRNDRPVVVVPLPRHSNRTLRWYNFVPQPTCAWRRCVWEAAGSQLDETLHYSMDWDLLHRFLDVGARFASVPTFLAGFRVHGSQKTQRARSVGAAEAAFIQRRYARRDVSFAERVMRSSPQLLRRIAITTAYRFGAHRIDLPASVRPFAANAR